MISKMVLRVIDVQSIMLVARFELLIVESRSSLL
jgi:hypothetical protein